MIQEQLDLHSIDITSREHKANPFPFYAALREQAPVFKANVPGIKKVWLISRYEDCVTLLKDDRFVKNRHTAMATNQLSPWMPATLRVLEKNMLDLDAPDHTRLKSLVHKAFTPRLIADMYTGIDALSNELLDKMASQSQIDFIESYALPIPLTVIINLLGVPHKDHNKFHHWTSAIVNTSSSLSQLRAIPNIFAFIRYLRGLTQQKRLNPQSDLLSMLVQAEEAGDKLSEDELLAMGFILLAAGHETTVNLIASGTLALLENPEQWEMLRDDPSLIKTAVEELVRYSTPVACSTERYASEDINLHGVTIPRGDMVLGLLASANRDETVFENPDQLDITRTTNRHLSFGQGVHYCLGAPLARMEAEIAFTNLIQRFPYMALGSRTENLRWRQSIFLRGLESLPVTL